MKPHKNEIKGVGKVSNNKDFFFSVSIKWILRYQNTNFLIILLKLIFFK